MELFFSAIVPVIIIIYIISKRNEFDTLRRSVQHESANIGIQMSKRTACLNDALNIAKITYAHEIEGIEKLTSEQRLEKLAYLGQKYPDLQSVRGYNMIMQEAMELNKDISATRELVNGNIRNYNDAISSFPGLIIAVVFRFKREKFIDEENIAENRKLDKSEVDFSRF